MQGQPHKVPVAPIAAASLGIALFTLMDVLMKDVGIAIGAYNALLWRGLIGTGIMGLAFFGMRKPWPSHTVLRVHVQRSLVMVAMALAWFWAIIRLPLAEAIAMSFIAPLIALYFASLMLGERIRRAAIVGSLLSLAGVIIIIGGRLGREAMDGEALWGIAAVLLSAVLYAYNLVLARRQAQVAGPVEIAFFQNLLASSFLLVAVPLLVVLWNAPAGIIPAYWPAPAPVPRLALPGPALLWMAAGASMLTVTSLLLLSWANARAEAQVLIPIEYTAFLWAAILGWLYFAEPLTSATILGTLLIVAGCILAARTAREPHNSKAAETA